jgi:lipopolysaccharide biosynthesis protein
VARAAALKPLFDLRLGWDEYPDEPAPYDGTILHALERLLPFAARRAGYGFDDSPRRGRDPRNSACRSSKGGRLGGHCSMSIYEYAA